MGEYEKGPWPDDEWVDEKEITVSPEFCNFSIAKVAVGEQTGEGAGLEGGALLIEFEDLAATLWRVTVEDDKGVWHRMETPRRVRIEVAGGSERLNMEKSINFISEHLNGQYPLPNWFDPFSPEMFKAELDAYKKAGLLDEGMETRELLDILQMQKEAQQQWH